MTDEEINFEELQEIVNSPLKNKRTIKDFVKTIFDLSNKNKQLEKENAELKEQIEKMNCCENCKKHRNRDCSEDKKFYARTIQQCDEWEPAE